MEAHIKKMIQLQKNPIPLSSGDDQENETSPAGRGIGSVNFRPIPKEGNGHTRADKIRECRMELGESNMKTEDNEARSIPLLAVCAASTMAVFLTGLLVIAITATLY